MKKYTLILPLAAALLFFNGTFQIKATPLNEVNPVIQHTVDIDELNAILQDTVKIQEEPASKEPMLLIDYVEVMPQFPGGDKALMKWLQENLIYPADAFEQNIQGRVILRFVITPDGSVDQVEALKSLHPSCDNEAVRLVKAMPKWIPAKQNGKSVSTYYSLPVIFKMLKSEPVKKPDSVQQLPVIAQDKHFSKDPSQIIYSKVEVMPQFSGGENALLKFLIDNMMYPTEASEKGIQGLVIIEFIITPNGSIEDIKVQRSLHPVCDYEAMRVVKKMPKWFPGMQEGKPVYVYYYLPVTFKLQKN